MSQYYALVLAVIVMLPSMAVAVDAPDTDQAWFKRSLDRIRQAQTQETPDWLKAPENSVSQKAAIADITQRTRTIAEQAISAAQSRLTQPEGLESDNLDRITLFVSLSMGKDVLKSLMETLSDHDNLTIVLRGLPSTTTNLNQAAAWLHTLTQDSEDKSHVSLDPTKFRAHGITTVPTLLIERENQVLASAKGITSVNWLIEQVDLGKRGDLGVHGATVEIAEHDLIEVMKKRADAIDWNQKKTAAKNNYWPRQSFASLPATQNPQRYSIDPSFRVTADIVAPNGQFIARKGSLINPLDRLPFNQKLIIFDASIEEQIVIALKEAKEARSRNLIPKFIVTRHAVTPSWENIETLENRLDSAFSIINQAVIDRFQLEHTPSVIEASEGVFIIREISSGV